MTDQLSTVLARIADESGPAPHDPTLWQRGRRSRRRRGTAAASGLVAGVIGLFVAAAAINAGTDRQGSPPALENLRPGLPTVVHGINGDGGLPLEANLAVGRASVAFSNDEAAFVVTSVDGAYHRLQLPGFDPARYDAVHPGLALSPDGRKLVFTSEGDDGSGQGARPSVVDLRSGTVTSLRVSTAEVSGYGAVVAAFDYNWSSDSIYLTYEVWAPVEWGQPLHCCGHGYAAVDTDIGAPVYVTSRWDADDPDAGEDLPRTHGVFPSVAVSPKRLVAKIDGGAFSFWDGQGGDLSQVLTDREDWEVRQFSRNGSAAALQPRGVGHALGVVRSSTAWGSVDVLPLDTQRWPQGAHLEVLGWVGETQLLVLVHPATGAETWEPGGDLTLFSTDPAVAATIIGRVDRAEGMSAFTFASDLAPGLPSTATP